MNIIIGLTPTAKTMTTDQEKQALIQIQIDNLCKLMNATYKWSTVVDHTRKTSQKLTFTIDD